MIRTGTPRETGLRPAVEAERKDDGGGEEQATKVKVAVDQTEETND